MTTPIPPALSYIIPDLLHNYPYKNKLICPHYSSVKLEFMAWLDKFHLFTPEFRDSFNKAKLSLLPALVYPSSSSYVYRSCTDLAYTFFVLDDLTDVSNEEFTRTYCETTMDAILHPDKQRPEGEHVVGEMARQFWKRASVNVAQASKERFIASLKIYLDAVILQAQRRDHGCYVCSFEEYISSRREDVGCIPSLVFLEMSLEVDIPHQVMKHPYLVKLNENVTDISLFTNDIYSYRKEILTDNANYNSVTVIMKANSTSVASAIDIISKMHEAVIENFLQMRDDVLNRRGFPSFGENIDHQVKKYVDGLCQYIYGQDEFYFYSGRYFGDSGLEIQKTRKVNLG